MIKVAFDAMTSERGVATAVAAAVDALAEIEDLEVLLVGDPAQLEPELAKHGKPKRATIVPASQVIGMDEEAGGAFKSKKDASVSVACRLVRDGQAQSAVSPGNTGASVVAATLTLGRISGIRRPGIMTLMPRKGGHTAVLDVGGVVDCRPEDLMLFGIMGSLYYAHVKGAQEPRVGLLSIGEEDIKGNDQTLAAFDLLKKAPIHFIGNVEGRDIFNDRVDVVVCDGFVGNVVLKTAEGVFQLFTTEMKDIFMAGPWWMKLGAMLSKPAFKELGRRASADQYGGAFLLGVAGNFIIAHGSANRVALKNAIRMGYSCARQGLVDQMSAKIAQQTRENNA